MKQISECKRGLWFASLLIVCCFVMAACSDDDDKNGDDRTIDKGQIVGTWECTHFEYWDKEDGEIVWTGESEGFLGLKETFYANGTCADGFGFWAPEENLTVSWFWGDGDGYKDNDSNYIWLNAVNTTTGTSGVEIFNIAPVVTLNSTSLIFEKYESESKDGVKYEYYVKVIFNRVSY